LAAVLLAELVFVAGSWTFADFAHVVKAAPAASVEGLTNTQALGSLIYTRYVYVFQAAGMILLVAMIGAIVLTHRARGGVRQQNVGKQNRRRPQDATRMTNPPVGQGVEL
ncbi:MAG: NADH-quinone oxidoreductase subunit, partial [Sphingomonas bacterium]|nr:NADH-quinone oxidoreductase subunit [Sphingomonas bacterium]